MFTQKHCTIDHIHDHRLTDNKNLYKLTFEKVPDYLNKIIGDYRGAENVDSVNMVYRTLYPTSSSLFFQEHPVDPFGNSFGKRYPGGVCYVGVCYVRGDDVPRELLMSIFKWFTVALCEKQYVAFTKVNWNSIAELTNLNAGKLVDSQVLTQWLYKKIFGEFLPSILASEKWNVYTYEPDVLRLWLRSYLMVLVGSGWIHILKVVDSRSDERGYKQSYSDKWNVTSGAPHLQGAEFVYTVFTMFLDLVQDVLDHGIREMKRKAIKKLLVEKHAKLSHCWLLKMLVYHPHDLVSMDMDLPEMGLFKQAVQLALIENRE